MEDAGQERKGNKSCVIKRSGIDLLSRVLRRSTIDETGFNGRVRKGIGWDTSSETPDHLITQTKRGKILIRRLFIR